MAEYIDKTPMRGKDAGSGVMERLTFDGNFCDISQCRELPCQHGGNCSQKQVWERLKEYEDTGLTPDEVSALVKDWSDLCTATGECGGIDRLRELSEADKDGRMVLLPCKVGDTVWVTRNPWTGKLLKKPLDAYVNGMKMYSHGLYVNLLFDTRKINGTRDYEINHIGKTVFLTREEAEKALEAMNDGNG